MKNTRLPGHSLQHEGHPFDPDGTRAYSGTIGHALCSCGEMSGPLVTHAARKRWHAEHKETKRAEVGES